jgi:hypothetical protein
LHSQTKAPFGFSIALVVMVNKAAVPPPQLSLRPICCASAGLADAGKSTDNQIVAALRQAEAGPAMVDICREMGGVETTFSSLKRRIDLGVRNVRERRQLRDEIETLKTCPNVNRELGNGRWTLRGIAACQGAQE